MTQCHVTHTRSLPTCRQRHPARHIHDRRRTSAGGGHFVECACSRTRRHSDFDEALAEWKRMHRIRTTPSKCIASNVVQLGLKLPSGGQP